MIDSPKRLDELGIARLIANAAELVHKQQKGGQPVGTLTPQALVVGEDGEVSLALGAASPAYTAPERLRGETGDRRSDVFSLGVILWEALAHEPLFEGEIAGEVMAAVLEGEYRSAQALNANVPPELEAICQKALSRTPTDRYPSCKVMSAELATVLDDAGYPEDNSAIIEYLTTRFVRAEPKPEVVPTSRPTPLPTAANEQARPGTQTLQGLSPRAEIDAAKAKAAADKADPKQTLVASGELKPPAEPRAKTPSAGGLPSWAMAQSAQPEQPEAAAEPSPSSTLPGVLGAPSILDKPPADKPADKASFNKTAILGSQSSADLVPQVQPPILPASSAAVPVGKKTEVHGSLADRLAAINNAGAPAVPGLPAVPPGADPIAVAADPVVATIAPIVPPNITTAETVPTPALAPTAAAEAKTAAAEAKAAAALEQVTQSPIALDATAPQPAMPTPPPSEAVKMPAARTATAVSAGESNVHPAAVVTLPRTQNRSDPSRPRTDGGVRDPLAGWGWGTGPHEAISDDDEYYDAQVSQRKRLVYAIGGAAAVVLVVIIAAFAFGGDKKKPEQPDVSAKQTEPAVDWSEPTGSAAPAPAQPELVGSGSAVAAGSAELAGSAEPAGSAVDPAAGSAAEPAPVAVPEPQPEPPVVAKDEPKPEPKVEPKPEPKPEPKSEPKKEAKKKKEPKVVAKAEPKKKRNGSWDPMDRRKEPKPVDPYAERKTPVDASAAYRAGIQQFARGDANGALTTFKAALKANPNFAPTWRGIGMVYERLGRRSQAKIAFRRYLQLSPSAGDAAQIRERMERL